MPTITPAEIEPGQRIRLTGVYEGDVLAAVPPILGRPGRVVVDLVAGGRIIIPIPVSGSGITVEELEAAAPPPVGSRWQLDDGSKWIALPNGRLLCWDAASTTHSVGVPKLRAELPGIATLLD